jgi:hypothetical protein
MATHHYSADSAFPLSFCLLCVLSRVTAGCAFMPDVGISLLAITIS